MSLRDQIRYEVLESFELQFPGFNGFLKVYTHPNFLSFGVLLVFYAVKFVLVAFCFESLYKRAS